MVKKRILVITIYDNNNYGNKLQNYALQEVIKSFDYKVETLVTTPNQISYSYNDALKISIRKFAKLLLRSLITNVDKDFFSRNLSTIDYKRIESIKKFDKLIIKSHIKASKNNFRKINETYDYFVFGSDQVWNPNYILNYSLFFGRYFDNRKKISYAASMGVDYLEKEYSDLYKELLKTFISYNISVRENNASKIIKKLTGYNAKVVLDPTMLINREERIKLSKKPRYIPKREYILTYILGNENSNNKEIIENIAKENELEVINLMDKSNSEIYTGGVENFLWYVNNSRLVIADSFHAGVFSILFNKDFYIINREGNTSYSMNSRFSTLLSTFQLEDRFILDLHSVDLKNSVEYGEVNRILAIERKKSLKFIKGILDRN